VSVDREMIATILASARFAAEPVETIHDFVREAVREQLPVAEKIERCPFCGGVGDVEQSGAQDVGVYVWVKCQSCGATTGPKIPTTSWTQGIGTFEHRDESVHQAVARWNRRAS
jgi:Lar family restriction alleviation protein